MEDAHDGTPMAVVLIRPGSNNDGADDNGAHDRETLRLGVSPWFESDAERRTRAKQRDDQNSLSEVDSLRYRFASFNFRSDLQRKDGNALHVPI